jgi:hypothetical protein
MPLPLFNSIYKLVLILILINIYLTSGQVAFYEFCNEINTPIKINCTYSSSQNPNQNQNLNNFYSFDGNYSQITNSPSTGYTLTNNNSARVNYLEIKNLNTRDRKIVAGTGTTSPFIRCEYKINLYGNYYFNFKVK